MYQVKTNENGEKYVEVPVNFTMKVFIDEDNELDEVDAEYVTEILDNMSVEQLGIAFPIMEVCDIINQGDISLSKNIF